MLAIVSGFILGIFLGSFGFVSWSFILTTVCLSGILYYYNFSSPGEEKYKQTLVFVSIFLIGISLGLLRIHFSDLNQKSQLENFVDRKTDFTGIVVAEPDVREKNTMLTVLLQTAQVARVPLATTSPAQKVNEKIIISVSIYPEFNYGDQISFSAKLSEPKDIESTGGRSSKTYFYGEKSTLSIGII